MARKTREAAEKTRQDILEAAFGSFSQKGFTRTTLEDVARTAGVTRGAVYWHFKDKLDLFMVLSEEVEGEAGVRPEDLETERVKTLRDLKEELLKFLAHFEKRDRYAVFYEMVNYRTEYTEELRPVLDRQLSNHRKTLAILEEVLERFKRMGLVRSDLDTYRTAISLIALVVGITAIWLLDPGAFPDAATVPAILDDQLLGLGQ